MTPGQLLWWHRRGLTLDQLAHRSGMSRDKVYRLIKAERWRTGEVVITERALRQMIKQGRNVEQIADKHLCSMGCIAKKLKQYGLSTGPRGNPKWAKEKCEKS